MSKPISKHGRTYTISVVMIVKDEADNLKISLPAVANWVDEIIILDSGSHDNSENVAKKYGAKWFVNKDWPGYGKQKQLAQRYASGDWILSIDADEQVSDKLKDSILRVIAEKPDNNIYGLKRIDYIWGHPIDSPRWIVPIKSHYRLYPKKFNYNDNHVHESLSINNAKCTSLAGFLLHHTAKDPESLISKRLEYSKTWAEERHQQGEKANIFTIISHTTSAFLKQYIIYGRFLKGKYGFIYAYLFSQYTFNKYSILYDFNREDKKTTIK